LKNKIKGLPEQEVDQKLNQVISIFRYLQDKDIFEDFYKQHLAARLLTGQLVNNEIEKQMISKLTGECGHQFTARLEGMFKDMELSKELMKGYKNSINREKDQPKLSMELSVTVLTTGFWPLPAAVDCILPPQAGQSCEHFMRYYTNLHSGRKLTWQTSLGQAELRCQFEKGRKELVVHTYQMCILMMYNTAEKFTFAEIQKTTGIPEEELQRHLLSLAHPKVQVLKKTPNTKNTEKDHVFSWNHQYVSKLFRVKIPLLSSKSAIVTKKAEVPTSVLETRKNQVEAALVRVMKARKTLDHNNLIAEVVKQLSSRFAVEPAFIKKRIESLIDREYIQRDKDNRQLYNYIA